MLIHKIFRLGRWCGALSVIALTGILFGACDWSAQPSGTESTWEEADELEPRPTVIPPGATIVTFTFADTLKNQTKVWPLFSDDFTLEALPGP